MKLRLLAIKLAVLLLVTTSLFATEINEIPNSTIPFMLKYGYVKKATRFDVKSLHTIIIAPTVTVTYDFENLSQGSLINGQDNWLLRDGGTNTSLSLATVQTFASSGAYGGGKAFNMADLQGTHHLYATRVNNASFALPTAFDNSIIEVTYQHNRQFWGTDLSFGYDANGDGHIEPSEVTFGIFDRDNGNLTQVLGPGGAVLVSETKSISDWTEWKISVDLTANSGQGSISVSYRDLTNNGALITPANYQNINAGFNLSATDQTNPKLINGMMYSQEAGGPSQLDNITYSLIDITSPTVVNFTGFSTGNWGASGNWSGASVPTSSDDVIIPNGKVVNLNSTDANALSLNVNAGGTLLLANGKSLTVTNGLTNTGTFTIASDASTNGSVIAGSFSGSAVTYQRYFIGGQWHLFGPPVSGHLRLSFVTTNAAAMTTSGVLYSLAPYNQLGTAGSNLWSNYTSDGSNPAPAIAFPLGQGFEINMLASGTVDFTGSILTSTSAATLSNAGNAWNLIANPFASSVFGNVGANATNNFLTVNNAVLDASFVSMYIWNGSSYTVVNQASGSRSLAPGQAFFVKSNGGGNTSFTAAMRTHQSANNFQKAQTTGIPTVKLMVSNQNAKTSSTEIKYMSGTTLGLDPGFDAGRFDGVATGFSVYTRLVQDNGVKFSLQAVPDTGYDTTVITIGLDADVGTQLTIKAEITDLPVGKKVFLEDRLSGSFTEINNTDKFYTTTLSVSSAGVGRFFMHTQDNSSTLAIDDFVASKFTLVASPRTNNLKLFGSVSQQGSLAIYDSLGRMIYTTSLQTGTSQDINVPTMAAGVYFVKVKVDKKSFNKKIVWY